MCTRIRPSRRPRGVAVGVIMLITMVVGVLVASIGLMNTQTLHDIAWSTYVEQATYAARAGVQMSLVSLKNGTVTWTNDRASLSGNLPERPQLTYALALARNDADTPQVAADGTLIPPRTILVVSTGRMSSDTDRPTAIVTAMVRRISLFRQAVYVSDHLDVSSNSAIIDGSVGTSSTTSPAIVLANLANVLGTITVPASVTDYLSLVQAKKGTSDELAAKVDTSSTAIPYPTITAPTGLIELKTPSGSVWQENRAYTDPVSVNGGSILLKPGVYYFKNTVTFKGNVVINLDDTVTGSDPVKIFVDKTWNGGGCSIIDTQMDARRFQLYGTDTATEIVLGGNVRSDLLVYIKNGLLTLQGTGDLFGSFIGKTVSIVGTGRVTFDRNAGDVYIEPPGYTVASWGRR